LWANHGYYAFFGAVVHQSRLDYFRKLLKRIAHEVWDSDNRDSDEQEVQKYYAFGIFHINVEDGRAFRWRCRHGDLEELEGSEIACGMG
jgi:hypothetical protein